MHGGMKEGSVADVKRAASGFWLASQRTAPECCGPMTPFRQSLAAARETFDSLGGLEETVNRAAATVLEALTAGRKLLLCGNGGSACDAAHVAAEFVCRFTGDRRPYPALALGVDGGLLTAIGNDYEFNDIFARQVHAFGQPGDVFIGLSTSGKSRNVLAAIEEARRRGLVTVALLGRDGGFTKGAAEIELIVPGSVTARIQEAHIFLLHVLCELVEEKLPKE
jgi:D-sedoheptulose 7-phosphate isomerase